MSLMFAALKKLENPASAATVANTAAPASGRGTPLLRPWSVLPAVIGVALLGGGWLYSAGPAAQAADGTATVDVAIPVSAEVLPEEMSVAGDSSARAFAPEPVPAPSGMPPVATPATPLPAAAPATIVATPPALGTVQAAPEPVTPTPAPTPRPMVRPAPEPIADSAIRVREASEATPSTDGQNVARVVAALGTAIHNDDFTGGREQLARLSELLPPQSLTLVRMQAWFAHESGDTAGALALYRQIVARMPGDQTAVINLAILEAGNGEGDSARQRLQRLRTRDADSREIEHAIGLVEAQLR